MKREFQYSPSFLCTGTTPVTRELYLFFGCTGTIPVTRELYPFLHEYHTCHPWVVPFFARVPYLSPVSCTLFSVAREPYLSSVSCAFFCCTGTIPVTRELYPFFLQGYHTCHPWVIPFFVAREPYLSPVSCALFFAWVTYPSPVSCNLFSVAREPYLSSVSCILFLQGYHTCHPWVVPFFGAREPYLSPVSRTFFFFARVLCLSPLSCTFFCCMGTTPVTRELYLFSRFGLFRLGGWQGGGGRGRSRLKWGHWKLYVS